jgi:hypothetical protein
MTNITMAPDRRHGVGMQENKPILPFGGVFPDDVKVMKRIMPVPYNLEMEVNIFTTNSDQTFQILEQLLVLFDPMLQIQKNDAPYDWTKLTTVELMRII